MQNCGITLKCFIGCLGGKHLKFMIDNTTAVSVINNKGTSHNDKCNEVVCDIWALCEKHAIWLTAAYIPGKQNIIADQESRIYSWQAKYNSRSGITQEKY
jgi:hypothetical protein